MPQPDIVFFLDAAPDVLLSRKQEVSREALIAARTKYLQLCDSNSRFVILDASRPLEDVVAEASQTIQRFNSVQTTPSRTGNQR